MVAHKEDGKKIGEMSFRQTIMVYQAIVDLWLKLTEEKVLISFDAKSVDIRHREWLESVKSWWPKNLTRNLIGV